MNGTTVAFIFLVCWALFLIGIVIFVARKFANADRDRDGHGDGRDDRAGNGRPGGE